MIEIAAVVATHNRPGLLLDRCLASIGRQTRAPGHLIVVDDSDPGIRRANREIVDGFSGAGAGAVYLENQRTPGAAGAWNSALAHLQRTCPAAYVAILDDDDSWDPTYLERCEAEAVERGLDMVAAGLVFHSPRAPGGEPLDPPDGLNAGDLLVRNTHIQGSNLFVRLRILLQAGGFDEALSSTTDRDMCIRLADQGTVRYGSLREHLVHHHADGDRERLSTPGSEAKRKGLRYFYRKYRGRMSAGQEAAFLDRSRALFRCDPTEPEEPPAAGDILPEASAGDSHLDLVVGAITSPDVSRVDSLMDSLRDKVAGRDHVALKVVLLENGGPDGTAREALRHAVEQAVMSGLDVDLVSLEQQASDLEAGRFPATEDDLGARKSIALSRTMLQRYVFLEAKPKPGSVAWILDDDIVLEGLGYGSDGSAQTTGVDYVAAIREMRARGAGVVLCEITGDPPVPALSCVRTQLVDLCHNLHRLAALRPGEPFPDLREENRLSRAGHRDYHYDLSAESTTHLELPFWYEPDGTGLTAGQAFREMVSRLPGILAGKQVFRPLVQGEPYHVLRPMQPSTNRGPATLVFDTHALRDFPNPAPAMESAGNRRSDMVWSLLNRFVAGRSVVQSTLPVRQARPSAAGPGLDFDVLAQDIRGHALYSALRDVFLEKARQRKDEGKVPWGPMFLELDGDETELAQSRYRDYVSRRMLAVELSFLRIMGLLSALRRFIQRNPDVTPPWWQVSPEFRSSSAALRDFVENLALVFTDSRLEELRQRMSADGSGPVGDFLRGLPEAVAKHRAATPLPAEPLRELAAGFVREEFGTGPLTCLGVGEEGVVLTDGRQVYKYFHNWHPGSRDRQPGFLQSLAGTLSGYRTLPDLEEVRVNGDRVVAVYPYDQGNAYEGGCLEDLLTLLRECRQAGIACRNIHPDNLLVTGAGLKFIDYGADVVPFTGDEFEQMCRRAFLTYRFPFRSDLKRLMTRSLSHATMPELHGMDSFRLALDPRGLDELLYLPMAESVAALDPASVLDYGCGDGRLAEELSNRGITVVGYDPDPARVARCRSRGSAVEYGGRELLQRLRAGGARFDVVLCSRVLCTIEDNGEVGAVLSGLRELVSDAGTAIVAVCNPFHLETRATELAEKRLPEGFSYHGAFAYEKTVSGSGNRRTEIHRSWAAYRRAFFRAGFAVEGAFELDGADIRSLLPASDHLAFRLRPSPPRKPSVSLLIKTCLMEWRTIERLVRHQVGQMESPAPFAERVVVVDPSPGPFARQYDRADEVAHRAAMERLLEDGVVDRVLHAPQDRESVRKTYRKWFGAESEETHSANGQQLFATLFGFDSCTGDYVLQLDSDLLIHRADRNHDYLGEMTEALRGDPKALFVPLSICRAEAAPYSWEGPDGDWRVEVRGCLFDRRRLEAALPVENPREEGRFSLGWHRAFDRRIAATESRSYRGGDPRTAFIHVPNERKGDAAEWLDILGAVERGHLPDVQLGRVDLAGAAGDWAGPKRDEPFVFVICGRNVPPARFRQCFDSLAAQESAEWGAVVVDDASGNGFGEYAEMLLAGHADRVTLVRNGTRRGGLYNTWNAITNFCANPETVIITLDADDSLIGTGVLARIEREYEDGADVTVGSMLRLDKEARYPANFRQPRWWDSNVWQHLRTFRKRLFDAIDVEDLKMDGEWLDLAADWAYMVPIVEMAASPRHIPEPLYLYRPAAAKDEDSRRQRDAVIARILERQAYRKLQLPGKEQEGDGSPAS